MNRDARRSRGITAPRPVKLTVDEIRDAMARRVEAMVAEGTPRATAQLAVYESWMRVAAKQGTPLTGLSLGVSP